jgi:hypothetical protein
MKKDLIQEKIIDPLLRQKPKNVEVRDYLDSIFNVHTRIISTYFVKRKFTIPGYYMVNDTIPIFKAGQEFRSAKRLDTISVRVDDREPNIIHLEHKGHVFMLNRFEWNWVKRCTRKRDNNEDI